MYYRLELKDTHQGVFNSGVFDDVKKGYDCESEEYTILQELCNGHNTTHEYTEEHRCSEKGYMKYKHFFKSDFYEVNKEAIELLLNEYKELTLIVIDDYLEYDSIYEDDNQICILTGERIN